MQKLINTLLLLLAFTGTAQQLDQAVFTECLRFENPVQCTEQKFEADIWQLIDNEITNDLKKTLDKNYISISLVFATAESGRPISEFTEISCENILLKAALKNYIENLPSMHAIGPAYKDRRSVHILNYTFFYDDILNKYYPATKERLNLENITPPKLPYTSAICAGCENKNPEKANECTLKKINKIIQKKFDLSKIKGPPRKIKIIASFTIKKDGTMHLNRIICDEDNDLLKIEFKKAFNFFPEFIPANYKGIPTDCTCTLPLIVSTRN